MKKKAELTIETIAIYLLALAFAAVVIYLIFTNGYKIRELLNVLSGIL